MPGRVTALFGPASSGKTGRLLPHYAKALAEKPLDSHLWLAPNFRGAREVQQRLWSLSLAGCFQPRIFTFDQFAQAVLSVSGLPVRPVSRLGKRQILGTIIESAQATGRLAYFAPIAGTRGFLDQVCEFVTELKRLEIWPEDFLRHVPRSAFPARDEELGRLYDDYQTVLTQHQLYDAEGRFWSARTCLRDMQAGEFAHFEEIVVDGFADFTRTQHEILEILAQRAQEMWITLPHEPQAERAELFAKSAVTLAELARRHPELRKELLPPTKMPACPPLRELEQRLFRHPGLPIPAESAQGVEILAAPHQAGEVERIGRRIKQLLQSTPKVRPEEIVVIFRSLAEVAPLVRETFPSLGVPFALEAVPKLGEVPAIRALLGLLRLEAEDWPFRRVLSVLGSSYFRPDWPECAEEGTLDVAHRLVRFLQIPRGKNRLLRRVAALAEHHVMSVDPPEKIDEEDSRAKAFRWAADAARAGPLFRRLAEMQQPARQAATLREWGLRLAEWADMSGLIRIAQEGDSLAAFEQEAEQVSHFLALLHAGEAWRETEEIADRRYTAQEVLPLLEDIAHHETVSTRQEEAGRVRVLSAESARTLSVPYLFVGGLNERVFPLPQREDRLLSEAELDRLARAGVPLTERVESSHEEMLLFYEVVTRAQRQLFLSYAAMNDKAEALSPSPYLTEVERCFAGVPLKKDEDLDLRPVSRTTALQTPADVRLQAAARLLEGDERLMATLGSCSDFAPLSENVARGLAVSLSRQQRGTYGLFEGIAESAAAQAFLEGRFGNDHHWSPVQLERYAMCPFRFFLERIVRAEPSLEPQVALDPARTGTVLHAALARFHAAINAREGEAVSPGDCDENVRQEIFAEALAQAVGGDREGEDSLLAAQRHIDRRLVERWFSKYLEQHGKYEQKWPELDQPPLPRYFEVTFGERDHGGTGTAQPLELMEAGRTIKVVGRIDRIDLGEKDGRPVFTIVDYKSGSHAGYGKREMEGGFRLQLPLYALAVEELILSEQEQAETQPEPLAGSYWFVRDKGFHDSAGFNFAAKPTKKSETAPWGSWPELKEHIKSRIFSLVQGIQAGQFPMHSADEHCTSYCPFHTVCRVAQTRNLEKTWEPPPPQAD